MDRVGIIGIGYEGFLPAITDLSTRELMYQAASKVYGDAQIDQRKQIDLAEAYYPFDYEELHHLEGLLADKGEAGKRQMKREVNREAAQAWGDLMQVGAVITMKR